MGADISSSSSRGGKYRRHLHIGNLDHQRALQRTGLRRVMKLLAIVVLLLASCFGLAAQNVVGGSVYGDVKVSSGGSYVGAGDTISGALAWWGLRCYSNAYSG